MKNLSVDMPLAVPHQKPPSKYASRPYPNLQEDVAPIFTFIPLNVLLRPTLRVITVGGDTATSIHIQSFDITLKSMISNKNVDEKVYSVFISPLTITLKNLITTSKVKSEASHLALVQQAIRFKRVVIIYNELDNNPYSVSIKQLKITFKRGA